MKKTIICNLAMLSAVSAFGQKNKQQPNIIFIMSDDHAEQAISAYGHPISKLAPTPNIDRIAEDGAIFMNNYCCNSISGPSRAAILTGKHSHKNGFVKNENKAFDGTQQTLPKILQKNGYQTAIVGKWHLLSKPTGFDHWQILNGQGEYCNPYFITEQDTTHHMGYVTDLITDFTKEWLDGRDKEKPFFLMMHHKAPHRNWVPAERHYRLYEHTRFPVPDNFVDDYAGRYAASQQEMTISQHMYEGHDLKMTAGIENDSLLYEPWPNSFMGTMTETERKTFFKAYRERNNDFYLTKRTQKEIDEWKYQRYLQDYLACIKSVDESVGEILDYLKASGLDENTIVIYTSDQGFYLGEHGWFDKRFMYEESFGMPLVMSYKEHIKPGTKVEGLTQNIDFAPTLLDMCGINIPDDMQGESFSELAETGKTPKDWRKSLYYHYYEFPGFHSVRAHEGVKMERYKLLNFYKENKWELYDLKNDPTEMNNIYYRPGNEKIKTILKKELSKLQKKYDVPKTAQFENGRFIQKGFSLPYKVSFPDNYDDSKQYPLIVFLHGAGERGNDNEKQLIHGSSFFVENTKQKYPSIVIAPQCPADNYWSNVTIHHVNGKKKFSFEIEKKPTTSMEALMSLINEFLASGKVDKGRVYVGGLSMGGMGTLELLWRMPNTFSAAFPVCGAGSVEKASSYAKDTRIWFFHGDKDEVVPPESTEKMYRQLKKTGYDVKYTMYKNVGHNAWDYTFKETELFAWLFNQ